MSKQKRNYSEPLEVKKERSRAIKYNLIYNINFYIQGSALLSII